MSFSGFGERMLDFYEGLEADNSKPYWTDHKAIYDEHVRAPMLALLAELADEFGDGKVFRPHRDVRFSRDKRPYKTGCGAIVHAAAGMAGLYVQVDADGMLVAGGCYSTESDQVQRYRDAVADQRRGDDLRGRLDTLRAKGFTVEGNQLKTTPRGYPADHPRIDLLRHRTLYAQRRWIPDDTLHQPAAADRVRTAWRQLRPLTEWVDDHVGASTLAGRRAR